MWMFAIGQIVQPLLFSIMADHVDYRICTDVFGIFSVAFGMVYIACVYERRVFRIRNTQKSKKEKAGKKYEQDVSTPEVLK